MAKIRPAKPGKAGSKLKSDLCSPFFYGIVSLDSSGRVSLLTDAAARILGIRSPRARPKTLKALPVQVQEAVAQARSAKGRCFEKLIEGQDEAGAARSLHFTVLTHGASKSPVTIVFQDLTYVRLCEQNLWQLERLAITGTRAAGMAHEIKNALTAGRTFFDLLLEKHEDAELVELARRELARIDSLVTQMLRFISPAKPSFTELRLHEVLDHSLRLIKNRIQDKSIQLDRAFAAPSDLLEGDNFQLEQAFLNLLLNAIEAMEPYGRLTVATQATLSASGRGGTRERTHLRVTIQDTGIGIPRENIGRLFGPFFTTKNGGTGLGLSITRRIIQEHGGQISVKSKPNKGAAFQIILPTIRQ